MKKYYIAFVIATVALVLFFMRAEILSQSKKIFIYDSQVYGISFSYPIEYLLTEKEAGNAERKHYSIVLIGRRDLPLPQNGEGPPAMSVDIYQNDADKMSLNDWLVSSNDSNFKISAGTPASTTVSGSPAVHFRWSGLYEGVTYAFLHRGRIFAVSGTYLVSTDPIVSDFRYLVSTIELR